MTEIPDHLTLSNGIAMPLLGLGVYRSGPAETVQAVSAALSTGWRVCHGRKTAEDIGRIRKADRQRDKHSGA